jgi:DNA repair exonuclease SbcCD ATPase subunit
MAWKGEFAKLCAKTHSQQAIWWLNGFWDKGGEKEAKTIYEMVQKFKELEYGGKVIEVKGKQKEKTTEYKEGCDLDEFKAHRFLESYGETLTVVELRKRLEAIDIDKNKKVALSEYLLFKYKKTPQELVDAPQGDNQKEIAAAQAQVAELDSSLKDLQQKQQELAALLEQQKVEEESARQALEAAKVAKEAADKALADQQAAEAKVRAAEAELRAAVDDLRKQEEDYKNKVTTLEAKTQDSSLSTVQKSKAVNELAQLKGEDPLPLRKAKITQEAALRKVEKERKAAEAATAAATQKAEASAAAQKASEDAAEAAEQARVATEGKSKEVDAAVIETQTKFDEAVATLETLKKKSGSAQGALWWMSKEVEEARKWLAPKKS